MTTDQVTVAILGAGSWGTTFAKVLADAAAFREEDITIRLWARRDEVVDDINTNHTNSEYLDDIVLPDCITASNDAAKVVRGAELVVVAVPAQQARTTLHQVADAIGERAILVSLIKGLEQSTQATMSKVFAQELNLPSEQFVVVSGPNLAKEIARQEPTATVVACEHENTAEWVAAMTASEYFRPYRNTDIPGVELGGVVKNIIALAVGLTDGRGFGDNSKASIITRGLTETTRLATALGANPDTLAGLAGLGDLVATCASPLSRNRTAGKLYGQGHTTEEVISQMRQTAEGVKSVPAVVTLAHSVNVEMPIAEAVNAIVAGTIEIHDIASLLLGRDLKPEARL
ncbi:MAG: NAD(P)H-dependent glycerol-3-phosphate dehydrogenase [Yaniella sp.]|uniref:NAD(P)H-dependent glycerol-3-phosphate dehydrogenase n=4 Tax=Yaniella sp. TaxID=2773929 RepID=UPI00183FAFEF|nr:NAD(P)H-dependent glycerol-3-phosphate dehydrogenase [Yaniella sp.]NLZ98273.1 NAD(P)-dependent glycerol-3-phosphate dehydrogenase [Micrococcus sp.]MDN5703821.1 NAD(P)-dependent glycerol-3-phosphate dehydrogenase [Yaniella sp.]MDN5731577.1 NAD(P)-dependent glycerol-3-phosphate dehydrogenase [Yaniella sp.]MDN5742915.1 NAD(P)-dependent glycerol-3-phosphate dehydrogenase [Yaniella sp.]MDN5817398.1 NAD(P)-dependent glycerol-3-phosphate dehydrogenase [Yaniella sp.]